MVVDKEHLCRKIKIRLLKTVMISVKMRKMNQKIYMPHIRKVAYKAVSDPLKVETVIPSFLPF